MPRTKVCPDSGTSTKFIIGGQVGGVGGAGGSYKNKKGIEVRKQSALCNPGHWSNVKFLRIGNNGSDVT